VGFRLKSGQAISSEIRRIVLRQLDLATSELKAIGDPESDEAIHDARRRVKKIRAVIRLVRPVLDKSYRTGVDPELRRVSRMLAPVADGQGVIDTLNVLARRYRKALPRRAVAALRADLVERERRIDARADAQHVLQKATRALRAQRRQIKEWKLNAEGFSAIAPGLRESVRRARHAMAVAWAHPTPRHFHSWRRYVKDHWFHVRLLEAHCGNHLVPVQRRLEALDGMLGEYHNLVLLREVLLDDSALAPLDRSYCLRVVARYQRALRQQAQILGVRTYSEKPRRFVRRVKRLWQTAAKAAALEAPSPRQ
jgi:CHAD domain-containing protein